MVIFYDAEDRARFLLEIGKGIHEADSEDDHNIFIKKRTKTVKPVKQYFRRRAGERGWLSNSLLHTFAIRRWHHSPEGRKRHRQLATYLATRRLPTAQMSTLRREIMRECTFYQSVIEQALLEVLIDQLSEDIEKGVLM